MEEEGREGKGEGGRDRGRGGERGKGKGVRLYLEPDTLVRFYEISNIPFFTNHKLIFPPLQPNLT